MPATCFSLLGCSLNCFWPGTNGGDASSTFACLCKEVVQPGELCCRSRILLMEHLEHLKANKGPVHLNSTLFLASFFSFQKHSHILVAVCISQTTCFELSSSGLGAGISSTTVNGVGSCRLTYKTKGKSEGMTLIWPHIATLFAVPFSTVPQSITRWIGRTSASRATSATSKYTWSACSA